MAKKQTSATKIKVAPLADRVLLKELRSEEGSKTDSGIYIPETVDADKGAKKGKVVAVGEGRYEDGKLIPIKVKLGDTVLFQWGDKVSIDGEEYYFVKESEIIGIIK